MNDHIDWLSVADALMEKAKENYAEANKEGERMKLALSNHDIIVSRIDQVGYYQTGKILSSLGYAILKGLEHNLK